MHEKAEVGKIRENCSKIYSLVVDSENSRLFYATVQFTIKVYDLKKNYILKYLKGHSACIWVLRISKDQKYLFSGGNDRVVMIWDLKNNFKLIHKLSYGMNIFSLAIGPLNRKLYIGGSKYKPITQLCLKNVLKSSVQEFNETLLRKRKLNRSGSQPQKIAKSGSKPTIKRDKTESELMKNDYVRHILSNYESWITTLKTKDQRKVKQILINSAVLQEQNSKMRSQIGQRTRSDIIRRQKSDQSLLNVRLNKSSMSGSKRTMESELVDMIKKHHVVLNEKKILNNLVFKTKSQYEELEHKYQWQEMQIKQLESQNEKLKLKMAKLETQNQKYHHLMQIKIQQNNILTLKVTNMQNNFENLKKMFVQNQTKLENWKKIGKDFETKSNQLTVGIEHISKRTKKLDELEKKSQTQRKYIKMLEEKTEHLQKLLLKTDAPPKRDRESGRRWHSVNWGVHGVVLPVDWFKKSVDLVEKGLTSKFESNGLTIASDKVHSLFKNEEAKDQEDTEDSIKPKLPIKSKKTRKLSKEPIIKRRRIIFDN